MITFWQYLKEIHDSEIAKISKTLDNSREGKYEFDAEHIFHGKKRITFPIKDESDAQSAAKGKVESFIDKLKSKYNIHLTIDNLKSGYINVDYRRNQVRISTHIGKVINEINKERNSEEKITEEEINKLLDELSVAMDRANKLDYNTKYSVIVSRDPIDMLRMGDHVDDDGNKMKSCHSLGRSHYRCAVRESQIGSIIAYAVKSEDLKKIDLQANEIFRDKDRGVIGTIQNRDPEQKGIYPLERLRFRRFYHRKNKITIFVPELKTYPLKDEKENPILIVPGFRDAVVKWAKDSQKNVIAQIDPQNDYYDFNLRGADYQDYDTHKLWNDFFGTNVQGRKIPLDHYDDDSLESLNGQVKKIVLNNKNYNLNYNQRDIYYYIEYETKIDIDKKSFIKIPTQQELNQELIKELKSKFNSFDFNFLIRNLINLTNKINIIIKVIGPDTEFEKDIDKYYDFIELIKEKKDYLIYIVYSWLSQNGYINYNIQNFDEFKKIQSLNEKLKLMETNNKYSNLKLHYNQRDIFSFIESEIKINIEKEIFDTIPEIKELNPKLNSFLTLLKSNNKLFDLSKYDVDIKLENYYEQFLIFTIKVKSPDTQSVKDIEKFNEFFEDIEKINQNFDYLTHIVYLWLSQNGYMNYNEFKRIQSFNKELKEIFQENRNLLFKTILYLSKKDIYSYIFSFMNFIFNANQFSKIPTREELLQESNNSLLSYLKSQNEIFDFSKFDYDIQIEVGYNLNLNIILKTLDTENKTDINKFIEFIKENKKIDENYYELSNLINYWFYKNNYIKNDIQNFLENKKLNHLQIQKISKFKFEASFENLHLNKNQNIIDLQCNYFQTTSQWFEIGDLSNTNYNIKDEIFEKFKDEYYSKYNIPYFNKYIVIFKFDVNNKLYAKFNFLFQIPDLYNDNYTKSNDNKIKLIEKIDQNFEKYVKIVKDWWQSLKKR